MAEALARHLAGDVIEPSSAGISPFGRIVEATRRALAERGVSLDGQYSKGLREARPEAAELVVNMSGIPGATLFGGVSGATVVDWDVEDPYGDSAEVYRRIRNEIEARVTELAADLRAQAAPQ